MSEPELRAQLMAANILNSVMMQNYEQELAELRAERDELAAKLKEQITLHYAELP